MPASPLNPQPPTLTLIHGGQGCHRLPRPQRLRRGRRGAPRRGRIPGGGDPVLKPVRIGSGRGGREVTVELVDSESDAFLSIGGSPGGDLAEGDESSGVGPLHAAEYDDSSSDFSDFGTARDYNFPSIFGDKNWYDEKLAGFAFDPFPLPTSSSGRSSEDKFSTGMQTGNIYGKQKNLDFQTETNMSSLKMPESREDGQSGDSDEIYGEYQSAEMISGENKSTVWYGNPGTLSQRSSPMLDKVVEPQALQEHGRMPINVSHVSHPVELIKSVVPEPSEKELHILSSSTHKVDVGDQKVGSWESDLLDYSFQMSISLKGEKNKKDSRLPGKELRIHSLSFGNEISYSTSSNEVDIKETKNTNHLSKESLTTTEESENLHSGFGSLFDTKREDSKTKLNDDGKQNSGSNNDDLLVSGEGERDGDDAPQIHLTNDSDYEVFDLRIVHRKNRTGFEENKDLPIILNSVIAGRYFVTEYLGSAAFSKVVQAHDLQTGVDVCLKIIKNNKDFFDQSLDEIKLLKFVNKHDRADEFHILRLYDYFYHQEHLFIVSELLKANLYEFQKYNLESGGEIYYTFSRIQGIALQCLKGLEFLHNLGIIHCDLKPENILIKSYTRCEIKIIDLGSSCFETDSLCLYVQSRSYRAPEVILGVPYDQKIDIWSLGCILAELFSGEVLFPNDPVSLLLGRMIRILGPFDMEMLNLGRETNKYFTDSYDIYQMNEETNKVEYVIPQRSSLAQHLNYPDPVFIDFLTYLLQTNPQKRPSAKEALQHPWLVYPYQ